jgi:hypothetical protein
LKYPLALYVSAEIIFAVIVMGPDNFIPFAAVRFVPSIETSLYASPLPVVRTESSIEVIVTRLVAADDVVVVVVVVAVPCWTRNAFWNVSYCPSEFFTIRSHISSEASAGIVNLHVMSVGVTTTSVAWICELPFLRVTFAPERKFSPVSSVIETVSPVLPLSGSTPEILGA